MATAGIPIESRDIPETDPAEFTGTPTEVSETPPEPPRESTPEPAAAPPKGESEKPKSKEYVREGRRFVAKDGEKEPKDPAEAKAPAEPETSEAPPAEAPVAAPEGAPQVEAAPEVAQEPADDAVVPYSFKAYGQEVTIPGAQYKPGHGIFIPEAQAVMLRTTFARAIKHEKLSSDNEQLRGQLRSNTTELNLRGQAIMDVLVPKIQSDDWLNELVTNPQLTRDRLALEIERKSLEIQQRLLTDPTLKTADPSLLQEQHSPEDISHELDVATEELLQRDEFKGVFTRADRTDLMTAIADRQGAYVVAAPQDIPGIGVKKGDMVIDQHALLRDLQREAQARQQIRGAVKPSPTVAKQNAQRTQSTISAPPSAVSPPAAKAGKATTQAKRGQSEPRWKDRAEYQRWLESDEL